MGTMLNSMHTKYTRTNRPVVYDPLHPASIVHLPSFQLPWKYLHENELGIWLTSPTIFSIVICYYLLWCWKRQKIDSGKEIIFFLIKWHQNYCEWKNGLTFFVTRVELRCIVCRSCSCLVPNRVQHTCEVADRFSMVCSNPYRFCWYRPAYLFRQCSLSTNHRCPHGTIAGM